MTRNRKMTVETEGEPTYNRAVSPKQAFRVRTLANMKGVRSVMAIRRDDKLHVTITYDPTVSSPDEIDKVLLKPRNA